MHLLPGGIRVDFFEEVAVDQIGTCRDSEAGRSLAFFEKGQLGEQPKGQSVLERQRTLGGVTNAHLCLHVDSVFVLRIKGEPWVQ